MTSRARASRTRRDLDALVKSIKSMASCSRFWCGRGVDASISSPAGSRWRLPRSAGLGEIPCLVHHVDDIRARASLPTPTTCASRRLAVRRPRRRCGCAHDGTARAGEELQHHRIVPQSAGRSRPGAARSRGARSDPDRNPSSRAAGAVARRAGAGPAARGDGDLAGRRRRSCSRGICRRARASPGSPFRWRWRDGPMMVRGDQDWLTVGLSGAIGGMLALVQR